MGKSIAGSEARPQGQRDQSVFFAWATGTPRLAARGGFPSSRGRLVRRNGGALPAFFAHNGTSSVIRLRYGKWLPGGGVYYP